MRKKIINVLLLVTSFFLFFHQIEAKKKRSHRIMYVVEDGVAVYKERNFDSPVITYLKKDKRLKASSKVYKGPNDFGSFYKVKISKGVFGYVADIDLYFKNKEGTKVSSTTAKVPEKAKKIEPEPKELESPMESLYYSSFIGASVNYTNMSETISGQKLSDKLMGVGFRLLGPGTVLEGVPLDTSISYVHGVPGYYDRLSSDEKSGFALMLDSIFFLPLVEGKKWGLFYGGGLSLTYTFYNVTVFDTQLSRDIDHESEEVRAGAVLSGALAYRLSRDFLVRLDGKYVYDSDPFYSLGLAFYTSY